MGILFQRRLLRKRVKSLVIKVLIFVQTLNLTTVDLNEFKEIIFYETYKRLTGMFLNLVKEQKPHHKFDLAGLLQEMFSQPVQITVLGDTFLDRSFFLEDDTVENIKVVIRSLEIIPGEQLIQTLKYELLESPWKQGLRPLSEDIVKQWQEVSSILSSAHFLHRFSYRFTPMAPIIVMNNLAWSPLKGKSSWLRF